eukprot:symbB.v1.2.000636.t1/scaffold7.1/size571927/4
MPGFPAAPTLILDSDEEDVVILSERPAPPKRSSKAQKRRQKEKRRKQRKRERRKDEETKETKKTSKIKASKASEMKATPKPEAKAKSIPGPKGRRGPEASSLLPTECCYRVRTAGDYRPQLCHECHRPLDAEGLDVAVVEVERPWLKEPYIIHAQLQCLTSAGLLGRGGSGQASQASRPGPDAGHATHGVLRSIALPWRPRTAPAPAPAAARPAPARPAAARPSQLASARQMAVSAALRAVRRAANDAADAALGRPVRRTGVKRQVGSELLEALLEVLPPARHAHREDVPKGEHCAICHGKLFKRTRKIRTLPCGHTFHDACILPWLSKRATCPLDRSDFTDLLKQKKQNPLTDGWVNRGGETAQNINKSLLALGDVVATLQAKAGHVNYRNSKLTMMLKDSLGGDSKTLMIVQCSPAQINVTETTSSLTFASKARNVELGKAKRNVKAGEG